MGNPILSRLRMNLTEENYQKVKDIQTKEKRYSLGGFFNMIIEDWLKRHPVKRSSKK